ncbi:universal stress protein [Acetonema longum]|uniref:UspA domain-containing protein n=1 Tax=Acetonema longum DSM 6540 TaxID=1009370 RepID=F7NE02_9FIRM|nr:universal stress protein [Acetonema longum]EGO65756.1 UspA domain-containing protein [Acetonema longum DSM 6540]
MKRDILVPFDGSPNALMALRFAIPLAKSLQEKIVVLNVQPDLRTPNVKRFFSEQDVRDYQQQMYREAIEPIEKELAEAEVDYELRLKIGDPKEIILKQAYPFDSEPQCSTVGVRMIIMGSRGMHPILGGVLGSVSYGVVNAAPCPVTIVPYSCE